MNIDERGECQCDRAGRDRVAHAGDMNMNSDNSVGWLGYRLPDRFSSLQPQATTTIYAVTSILPLSDSLHSRPIRH